MRGLTQRSIEVKQRSHLIMEMRDFKAMTDRNRTRARLSELARSLKTRALHNGNNRGSLLRKMYA